MNYEIEIDLVYLNYFIATGSIGGALKKYLVYMIDLSYNVLMNNDRMIYAMYRGFSDLV